MADILGTDRSDLLPGTGDPDTIRGQGGSDRIAAAGGDDQVSGGDGADIIDGGAGNDLLYGHGPGDPNSGALNATLIANVGLAAVFLTGAPGDDGFAYVLRKDVGQIVRIDLSSGAQSLFLDIPDAEFTRGGERGALGLAFHPGYETNGRFFVFLTDAAGDLTVREYARGAGNPPAADPAPVSSVITIPHPNFANHNGGSLAFGPDGYLYISTGDGGSANDPANNAQNLEVLLGKILRLDVGADAFPGDPARTYAIPAGNPFAGATAGRDEIWAYGLRNPWRISFDPATGDLYIGDVGQNAREEVDHQPAGSAGGINYGWDLREGTIPGPSWPPGGPVTLTEPVFDYSHAVGFSITGGYVYRGPAPGMDGVYFFADYVTRRLFSLRVVDGVAEDAIERTPQVAGAALGNIASFGTDNEGRLYAVTIAGAIYRLDPTPGAGDGADVLDGGAGDDTIFGNHGDDVLAGGIGADVLHGNLGNDVLNGMGGADRMEGGGGLDTAAYADAPAAVAVDLRLAGAQNTGGAGLDILVAIENLAGSGHADALTGNHLANTLSGGGGNDTLRGFTGNDFLNGEAGADKLYGDSGADTLDGGAGIDRLDAGSGNDTMLGGADADMLYGGPGVDRLDSGAGGDRIFANASPDTFVFGDPGDRVFGYTSGLQTLEIDASAFGGAAGAFTLFQGSTYIPAGATQTLFYDTGDGKLWLDADGAGPGGLAFILALIGAPALAAGDIALV